MDEVQVTDQITRALRSQSFQNGSEIRVRLMPESLGELQIRVISKDGLMVAEIRAGVEITRQILTQRSQEIQNVLRDAGIRIDQVTIRPMGGASESGNGREALNRDNNHETFQETQDQTGHRHRQPGDNPKGNRNPEESRWFRWDRMV
jgi:flagellar hook-length control protein FliK